MFILLSSISAGGASGGGGPIETSYANPGGTGDRTASITVTSSTGGLQGAHFEGDLSDLVDGALTQSSADATYFRQAVQNTGRWLRFDFGVSRTVSELTWRQNNANTHGDWLFQGSNDGSNFTDLTEPFLFGAVTQVIPVTKNQGGYQYYRLIGSSGGNTNTTAWLIEAEFKIDAGA